MQARRNDMNKYKIICLVFMFILFVSVACSKNTDTTNNINNKENNKENNEEVIQDAKLDEETDLSDELTKDDYKQLLITNYEKYIKPLDLEEYDDIKLVASNKEIIDNDSLVNEYKAYIDENRTNLRSFEQSMSNINIKELKIKEINNQLLKECKIYIRDLDKMQSYLEVIDQNALAKPSEEFINYLEEIIDNEEIEQSEFEEVIIKTQDTLGISLKEINNSK